MVPLNVKGYGALKCLRELGDLIALFEGAALTFDSCRSWIELNEERAEADARRPTVVKKIFENGAALVREKLGGVCCIVWIDELASAKISGFTEINDDIG
jgi:hypothetical protein